MPFRRADQASRAALTFGRVRTLRSGRNLEVLLDLLGVSVINIQPFYPQPRAPGFGSATGQGKYPRPQQVRLHVSVVHRQGYGNGRLGGAKIGSRYRSLGQAVQDGQFPGEMSASHKTNSGQQNALSGQPNHARSHQGGHADAPRHARRGHQETQYPHFRGQQERTSQAAAYPGPAQGDQAGTRYRHVEQDREKESAHGRDYNGSFRTAAACCHGNRLPAFCGSKVPPASCEKTARLFCHACLLPTWSTRFLTRVAVCS